ncbi:glycosyltransferase [Aeromonas caviae]|uniref:glycosyltransferase n=1 Tax=Aeromonas caviae TaxID=648 RepID=UPI0029DDD00D|nr:glycosyltransferase [Aeromonas caviae]MDX7817725.1 glycosyltransferase [Aeromonas caviae]
MRVAILSAASCIHTTRWANGLAIKGIDVHLISAHNLSHELDARVKYYPLKIKAPLGYAFCIFELRKLLEKIQPDILNTHYATGYGVLSRLAGFRPTLLSVWGSDVYDFPEKSSIHRWLLKGNLKYATAIGSTSNCMSRKTKMTFDHKNIFITPFGIDEYIFKPQDKPSYLNDKTVVGTIKTLENKYGIDLLIQAFARVWHELGKPTGLVLEITGGGEDLHKLQGLAATLGIHEVTTFHGKVSHERVAEMINRLDIYMALSRLESFGVAVLEASACEKPVIVSNAEGLAEVTLDEKMGFIVPKENIEAAAQALMTLIMDENLRVKMGKEGRRHVLKHYTWEHSLNLMIEAYNKTANMKQLPN